jgi:hypothetical protein
MSQRFVYNCRLDYAGHNVRTRISRTLGSRSKVFQTESTLEFDISGKKEIMLRAFDAVPMSLEQVTQLLLEPFFEFWAIPGERSLVPWMATKEWMGRGIRGSRNAVLH